MSDTPTIKTCPFCHSEKSEVVHFAGSCWVECTNCGACGPIDCKTDGDVIEAWNRVASVEEQRDQCGVDLRAVVKWSEWICRAEGTEAAASALAITVAAAILDAIEEHETPPKANSAENCNRLRDALANIRSLASWNYDPEADPDDTSPADQAAHVNGLIVRACDAALAKK